MKELVPVAFLLLGATTSCSTSQSAERPAAEHVGSGPTEDFVQRPAAEKERLLWAEIDASRYGGGPPALDSVPDLLALFRVSHLKKTFLHTSDEMPDQDAVFKRRKGIHAFGSVARFEIRGVENSPYTGLLSANSHGLLRLSIATQADPFTPGAGVKFLVNGCPSRNIVVMNSLDGQTSENFFLNPLSNSILFPTRPGPIQALGKKFQETVKELTPDPNAKPTYLPLTHLANLDRDCQAIEPHRAPFEFVLSPTPSATQHHQKMIDADGSVDFRTALEAIPAETHIYDVMTRAAPGDELVKLGELFNVSAFVSSVYGDEMLFFKHNIYTDRRAK